nr:NADH dehydrogenase subunit 4L [Dendrobaena tellermanica]
MYDSMLYLVLILPLVAMLNMLTNSFHFLMTLLSLEGITLTLVMFVIMIMAMSNAPNMSMTILLLTFGVCEASIGLSLMVLMSRSYGTDMLSSLSSNKC